MHKHDNVELNQNQKLALLVLAGLVIAAFGFWSHVRSTDTGKGIQIIQPNGQAADPEPGLQENAAEGSLISSSPVVVHVAGEVNKPDVYKLPPGSRVTDALRKAGGPTSSADLDALNLAAPLKDGEKILVPTRRQLTVDVAIPFSPRPTAQSPQPAQIQIPPVSLSSSQSAPTGKLKNPGDGVVNINTADTAELQRLPGVGPSTAQKIIEFRNQIGRFSLPDQLMDVKGIGPKKYEKMRIFITL